MFWTKGVFFFEKKVSMSKMAEEAGWLGCYVGWSLKQNPIAHSRHCRYADDA